MPHAEVFWMLMILSVIGFVAGALGGHSNKPWWGPANLVIVFVLLALLGLGVYGEALK